MKAKTAFDSSYSLGALVCIFSSAIAARSEGFEMSFEIAVSSNPVEEDNVRFVEKCLRDIEIAHSFVSFPLKEGKRYVSGISKSKLSFLDRPFATFLWLDSDTLVLGGLGELKELLNVPGSIYVVPRSGDLDNFNSGVFAVSEYEKQFEWSDFEVSDFFSDQRTLQQAFKGKTSSIDSNFNILAPWGASRSIVETETQPPYILHYVGEIKPWHINPKLAENCIGAKCSFARWFEVEQQLLGSLSNENREEFLERRRSASRYKPKHTSKLTYLLMSWQSKTSLGLPVAHLIGFFLRLTARTFGRNCIYDFHPYH